MKKFTTHFLEAKDPQGKEWDVVLIQAGKSENKGPSGHPRFYSPEVLKKAVPLFENAKAYIFELSSKLLGHLPEKFRELVPQGFVKNIIGWYDNAHYGTFRDKNGEMKEGVLARLHIFEGLKSLQEILKEAWKNGKKFFELSIDGPGITEVSTRDGETVEDVKEIKDINSVDIVTRGAAGGEFARLLASMEGEKIMDWKELLGIVKSHDPSLVEGIDEENILEEQALAMIKKLCEIKETPEIFKERLGAYTKMIDAVVDLVNSKKNEEAIKLLEDIKKKLSTYGYAYPVEAGSYKPEYGYPAGAGRYGYVYKEPVKETQNSEEEQKKQEEEKKKQEIEAKAKESKEKEDKEVNDAVKRLEEKVDKAECKAILVTLLAESDLPKLAKEKISKLFDGKIFKKEELEQAIKEEKEFISKLTESGEVKGLGNSGIEPGLDALDKLQVALDKMIDEGAEIPDNMKNIPAFRGLKEAYGAFHPEDPEVTGSIDRHAHRERLTEAITSADFSYALNTSMTKRIVREFAVKPFIFAPIVNEVPLTNFKQQERVKWGGWSTLPSVSEDAAYADGFEPKDQEATYTPGTKGYYVSVSRKTIKNDDLGFIKKIPMKVARAGKNTLQRDVANLLLANGTYTPTNSTVFSTLFANYSTDALSYDSLTDSLNRISAQKERGAAQDSGTADGDYATTTLSDSTKTWTGNAFAGYYVRLVYGTGAGQMSLIASNNATKLTFAAIATQPDATTKYEISSAQNDDEVMGLDGGFIVHGLATRAKVRSLLTSEKNPENYAEDNIHKGALTPIYCPLITGSTYQYYWFVVIPKTDGETIEIGYVDDQRTPTLVVQDQPALGQVFTNDRIRWRIRFEYGLAIIENQGIDANFATSV